MPDPTESKARWLLLIHQLRPAPAYLRVKTARQLQKVGAVAIKNSVYALPNSEAAHESFSWVAKEIVAQHGEASICESSFVSGASNESIEALFNTGRGADYRALSSEVRRTLKELGKGRRLDDEKRAAALTALTRFRRRHEEIAALDFFGAADGEAIQSLLEGLEDRLREPTPAALAAAPARPEKVRRATWVTRKGVHVDRIASAWLIRRFIDPEATFKFVPIKGYRAQAGERRFDMFEAEYTHEGDLCTFEVLVKRFNIDDPAVAALGRIVHEIDVRDDRVAEPETPGVERLIAGIALTQGEDDARLALGGQLLDALYASFKRRKP